MAKHTPVLSQLLRYVPRDEFRAIVQRHQADKGVETFPAGNNLWLFFRGN